MSLTSLSGAITPALSQQFLALRRSVIAQNDALRAMARTSGAGDDVAAPPSATATPFADALSDAVSSVNAAQAQSTAMTNAYERGTETDIASVMLARQKASVGFEATLQVRNKILSAYSDIMNMPV